MASTSTDVWNKSLEKEFHLESASIDRLGATAGLLVLAFLWGTLLALSWIAGFQHDNLGLGLRLLIIFSAVFSASLIFFGIVNWPYSVLAVAVCVLICNSIFIFLVFREVWGNPGPNATAAVISIGPASVFCIFWVYMMCRLPTWLAAANVIGFIFVVLVLSFYTVPFSLMFRQALYFFISLVSAHVMSVLTHSRERSLFLQRRLILKAKQSAEEALAKVEEARQEKERLIAAINHDLRQPMTAAVMHLDVLKRNVERGDFVGVAEQSRKARAAVDLLGGSLDHVLNAADDERASENFHTEPVDVTAVLKTLLDTYAPQAQRLGLQCRVRLPDDALFVVTNRQSLFRVLGNLVTNALKFTPVEADASSGVLIRASMRRGSCLIEVVDNGIGIAPDKIDDIWLPYRQLNTTGQDRLNGLGLGLFLVRRIVDQLPGHQIAVRSRLGRGTRFTLTIPCSTQTDAPEALASASEVMLNDHDLKPLSGAYVFLLEDDREARAAISDLLEEWDVIVASGANLETLKASHEDAERMVDAIVSDYSLQSGLNGLDAFDAIDEWLGYSPKRVLITGEDVTDIPRILASTTVTVLRKPFSPTVLAGHLLAAVDANRRLETS